MAIYEATKTGKQLTIINPARYFTLAKIPYWLNIHNDKNRSPANAIDEWPSGVDLNPSYKCLFPNGEVHTLNPTRVSTGVSKAGPQRAIKSGRGLPIQHLSISVSTDTADTLNNKPSSDT